MSLVDLVFRRTGMGDLPSRTPAVMWSAARNPGDALEWNAT